MGSIHQALLSIAPSAGGGITTPSDLADIWEWWEPSREGFSDNDAIGTLTGQFAAGSGHNWTQSTAGNKPTYKDSILNGLGIARFDGSSDRMISVNPTALTAVHIFAVVKLDSNTPSSSTSGLWSLGSGADTEYPQIGTQTQIRSTDARGNAVDFSKSGIDLSNWRVVEVVSTSSEWTFSLDGTQIGSSSANFSWQAASFIRLGSSSPFDNNFLDGDLAGMYICSAKLSADRAAMIDYLNSRFGLSAS